MHDAVKRGLQKELLAVFSNHGLRVAVGITHEGVAIRSQDPMVDAQNLSPVVAQDVHSLGKIDRRR